MKSLSEGESIRSKRLGLRTESFKRETERERECESPVRSNRRLPLSSTEVILPFVMDRSVSFTLGRPRHRRAANASASGAITRAGSLHKIRSRPLPALPAGETLGKSIIPGSSFISSTTSTISRAQLPIERHTHSQGRVYSQQQWPLPITPNSCRRVTMKTVENCREKRQRMSKSEDCLEREGRKKPGIRRSASHDTSSILEERERLDSLSLASSASHSSWCVMRSGGKTEFGTKIRVRPRSMDVALLLKRKTGSPMLLPSNEAGKFSLEKRGKFCVLRRNVSLEKMNYVGCEREVCVVGCDLGLWNSILTDALIKRI